MSDVAVDLLQESINFFYFGQQEVFLIIMRNVSHQDRYFPITSGFTKNNCHQFLMVEKLMHPYQIITSTEFL